MFALEYKPDINRLHAELFLVLRKQLDYEKKHSYSLVLRALEKNPPNSMWTKDATQNITVHVCLLAFSGLNSATVVLINYY